MTNVCQKCQTALPPKGMFCPACGAPLQTQSTPASTDRKDTVLLGRYTILQSLFANHSFTYELAKDSQTSQLVVLEQLTKQAPPRSQSPLDDIMRLCSLSKQETHVARYETAIQDQTHGTFAIRQHAHGTPLSERLRTGRQMLSLPESLAYLLQMCAGVRAFHKQKLVIGHLQPGLFFATEENQKEGPLTLLGTGALLSTQPLGPAPHTPTTHQAAAGYLAPEQLLPPDVLAKRGWNVSTRTDIYAIGVIAYKLLTGSIPYRRKNNDITTTLWKSWRNAIEFPPAPPSSFTPDLPLAPVLDKIVLKSLEVDPGKRFQSIEELQQELLDVAKQLATQAIKTPAHNHAPQTGEFPYSSGGPQPTPDTQAVFPASIPSLPSNPDDLDWSVLHSWTQAVQPAFPAPKGTFASEDMTDTFLAVPETELPKANTTPKPTVQPPQTTPSPLDKPPVQLDPGASSVAIRVQPPTSVNVVNTGAIPTPEPDAPFDTGKDDPFETGAEDAPFSLDIEVDMTPVATPPVASATSKAAAAASLDTPQGAATQAIPEPTLQAVSEPEDASLGIDFSNWNEDTSWQDERNEEEPDAAPASNKLTLILVALLGGMGALVLFFVFASPSGTPKTNTPPRTRATNTTKAKQPTKRPASPRPRTGTTTLAKRPVPRRTMSFSGFRTTPIRRAAPRPQPRARRIAPRPRIRRRVIVRRRPIIRRVRPRRRIRVARRIVRKASTRRRSRRTVAGCPATSTPGMRTIRLRSKGISLRKIAIRANNKIVRVTGRGCAAIPTSTRMLVVAYKPDVTAYHLCMIKLRKSRTRVTFKLTDANLVPPANGDCSR